MRSITRRPAPARGASVGSHDDGDGVGDDDDKDDKDDGDDDNDEEDDDDDDDDFDDFDDDRREKALGDRNSITARSNSEVSTVAAGGATPPPPLLLLLLVVELLPADVAVAAVEWE